MTAEFQNVILSKLDEAIKVLTRPEFYLDWAFWSTVVISITLGFLIWYAIETHKLADQAKDANLRPVILRSGFLKGWDDLKYTTLENGNITGSPLEFTIQKNIATSIKGYVIRDKRRYELLFGNDISRVDGIGIKLLESWGWMQPDKRIYALFNSKKYRETSQPNQIVIQYNDIEGNSYYTIEDENFNQKSYKGNIKY